jgi:hypothetical protein
MEIIRRAASLKELQGRRIVNGSASLPHCRFLLVEFRQDKSPMIPFTQRG